MNRNKPTTPYLNRNVKGEEPQLSLDDGDGVEGDEMEGVVEDLHADAAAGGGDVAEGAAAVGDVDDEGVLIKYLLLNFTIFTKNSIIFIILSFLIKKILIN